MKKNPANFRGVLCFSGPISTVLVRRSAVNPRKDNHQDGQKT